MAKPWKIIEAKPEAAAALSWRRWLGPAFNAVAALCLRETRRTVERIPCPGKCACSHRVHKRGAALVGVCDCGEECDDVPLTNADVKVWELDLKRLGSAIAGALKCAVKDEKLELDRTRQIASLGTAPPLPILLTVQQDAEGFGNVVAHLVAKLPNGFVLLSPSSQFCMATATDMLGRVNAGFFDLETHVELLDGGRLHAAKTGAELFAAHLPEMKDAVRESDIVRALQMFGGLMGLGTRLKKASPARVFDLMVFKKKTKAETATACKCVASLITKRVALIEEHFHMPMPKLLALSSPMQERLRTVKGERYAKKKHGATCDEPEKYKDDDDAASQEEYRYENGSADD